MERNLGSGFSGSSGLSDAKKRRLAVLDSKLAGSHKKRKETPRPQFEVNKISSLPQPQKRSDALAKGQSPGTGRLTPTPGQEDRRSRESPGSSAPPYDGISHDVHRGRLVNGAKPQAGEGAVGFVDSLLEDVAATNPRLASAKAGTGLRIQDKTLLLDNPAKAVKKQLPRRHGSQVAMLSGVKLRKLGLHALRPDEIRYENLRKLNERWQRYAKDAMCSAANPEDAALLLDLHGCLLEVKEHRNPQLIGKTGFVVRYSKDAFHIVSAQDSLHVVPRLKDCGFHIVLEQVWIVLRT